MTALMTLTLLSARDTKALLAFGRVDLLSKNAARSSAWHAYVVLRTLTDMDVQSAWRQASRLARVTAQDYQE